MNKDIQVIREKKFLSKVLTASDSVRPEFHGFKDLPELESLVLGKRPAQIPAVSVEVKAEVGLFSTKYFVFANFLGTAPLSSGPSGTIRSYAQVSPRSIQYFTPEGESVGVNVRKRTELEKTPGISSAIYDDYSLGIEGNLDAVIKLVTTIPLFKEPVLSVLKAVAIEAGDLKVSSG